MQESEAPSGANRLQALINQFIKDCELHIKGKSNIVMESAWLLTGNVIVDLLCKHTNIRPTIVTIDTLHMFPETHAVMNQIQSKYGLEVRVFKPKNCQTRADFDRLYGKFNSLSDADYNYCSKIEPLKRAYTNLCRRRDQGNHREKLDVWEEDRQVFNPLSEWLWSDVCDYVCEYNVPYNPLHKRVYISNEPIEPMERADCTSWTMKELELPFFAYKESYIRSLGKYVYVWKSFGDVHSSSQVTLDQFERAGRFLGKAATECGIHTRISIGRAPHGGKLSNGISPSNAKLAYHPNSKDLYLNESQVCDLEMLINGAYSPLEGFMNESTYNEVVQNNRLPEGQLWGVPVTLDIDEDVQIGVYLRLLSDDFGGLLAVMRVDSKWIPDRKQEALKVYGTDDLEHPDMHQLKQKKRFNVGGKVFGIKLPMRQGINYKTPQQIRRQYKDAKSVIAYQWGVPIDDHHLAWVSQLSAAYNAELLIHSSIGPNFDAKFVQKTFEAQRANLPLGSTLEYLPSTSFGGVRGYLQGLIISKNFGCTHVVDKDHGPHEFQGISGVAKKFAIPLLEELGIEIITPKESADLNTTPHQVITTNTCSTIAGVVEDSFANGTLGANVYRTMELGNEGASKKQRIF